MINLNFTSNQNESKTNKQKRIEKMKLADCANREANTKTHRTQSRYYYQQYAAI